MVAPWTRSKVQVVLPVLGIVLLVAVSLTWGALNVRSSPVRPDRQVVLASGSWAPYVGQDLPGGGPVAQLVTDAFAAAGYDAEIRWTSWSAALSSAERGGVTATFPFVGTASRRDSFLVSAPILDFEYVLFARRVDGELPSVATAEDIGELTVGVVDGYDYWPALNQALGRTLRFATSRQAFQALADGEVDLVPEGRQPGTALLGSGVLDVDREAIGFLDPGTDAALGQTSPLSLLMPRRSDSEDVMAAFDRGLERIRDTESFIAAVTSLDGPQASQVRLGSATGAGGVVVGTADGRWLLVPSGTAGRVREWPVDYLRPGRRRPDPLSATVSVTLLTGPSAGRVVQVDARDLVLDAEPVPGGEGR